MNKISTVFACLLFVTEIYGQSRYTSTSPGFIGVNTNSPTSFVSIEGNESVTTSGDFRTFLKIYNKSNSNSSFAGLELSAGEASTKTVLQHVAPTYFFPGLDEYADFGQLYSRGAGLIVRSGSAENPNGIIKFMTGLTEPGGSSERMRITSNGNVGIGTQSPKVKLQVSNGDVYVSSPQNGIILTSPNGSCWRVTIDDMGNFNRNAIACPN